MRRHKHTPDPKIERLRSCKLFASFPDSELEEISRTTDEVRLPTGHVLMREGDASREAFLIIAGECLVDAGGTEIAVLGPGDLVGEMGLLELDVRSATVVATEPTQVLAFDPRAFSTFVERRGIRTQVMRQLAERVRRTDQLRTAG